jgi:hypothetical protein
MEKEDNKDVHMSVHSEKGCDFISALVGSELQLLYLVLDVMAKRTN